MIVVCKNNKYFNDNKKKTFFIMRELKLKIGTPNGNKNDVIKFDREINFIGNYIIITFVFIIILFRLYFFYFY